MVLLHVFPKRNIVNLLRLTSYLSKAQYRLLVLKVP